jgi:hypothetical protein
MLGMAKESFDGTLSFGEGWGEDICLLKKFKIVGYLIF